MKRALDLHLAARADLIEIAAYIAGDNPAAAESLVDAAHALFDDLAIMPRLGRPFPVRGLRGVRRVPLHGYMNYNVYYIPRRDAIEVLRVLHGARLARPLLGHVQKPDR